MMYQSGYVLVVKDENGKVLRETGPLNDKQVFLPYNSEYSLLLKNKNNCQVVAEVSIDGTDVLHGTRLLIEANSDYELKRFLRNGQLKSGHRFKFVSPNHPEVHDPSDPELGRVTVRFFKVEDNRDQLPIRPLPNPYYPRIPRTDPWAPIDPWKREPLCFSKGSQNFSCSVGSDHVTRSGDNSGATVEGGRSNQRFEQVDVGKVSSHYTEIGLQILAPKTSDSSITVGDTRYIYCSACGHKNPSSANYCANCGAKLLKSERY